MAVRRAEIIEDGVVVNIIALDENADPAEWNAVWASDDHVAYAAEIREKRNRLLAETDWWANSDRVMTEEEAAYRQALRDITEDPYFPYDVTWPSYGNSGELGVLDAT